MAMPDAPRPDEQTAAIDQFDQQSRQPMTELPPEARLGDAPALGGQQAMGPGMAVMEQRLRQVEGDPTLLIGNQFKLEEQRLMQAAGGPLRESRPW